MSSVRTAVTIRAHGIIAAKGPANRDCTLSTKFISTSMAGEKSSRPAKCCGSRTTALAATNPPRDCPPKNMGGMLLPEYFSAN
jgi:hypothetical protein